MGKWLSNHSISHDILETILELFHRNPIGVARAGGRREYKEMIHWKEFASTTRQKYQIRRAIQQLEEKKYIQTIKKGDEIILKLSDKGFEEALKLTIIEKQELYPDNRGCYVSFDIPEAVRDVRHMVRYLLKRAKFEMIHQSLWYSPRCVGEEFAELVRILGIEKLLHVFIGESLNITQTHIQNGIEKKIRKKKHQLAAVEIERKRLREKSLRISLK